MLQQSLGCLLNRGEVRERFQAQILHQFRHIFQQRDDATIALALMRFEDQNGEQLVLGKLPRAEAVGVGGQRLPGNLKRFKRHPTR